MADCLSGTVQSVVYRNDETGYTVFAIRPATASLTGNSRTIIVGNCATIWEGEEVILEGDWRDNAQYGRQFAAEKITCIAPSSVEGITRYLSSGMIKGVGPKTAQKIVAKFGESTLDILEQNPQALSEIRGLGKSVVTKIKDAWSKGAAIRDVMIFLQAHGIGTRTAANIVRQYGADAIAIVKRNPYRLARDVYGIGFKKADDIALAHGIQKDSILRAEGGLLHCLMQAADDQGHCYMLESELLLSTQEMLDIPIERLTEALAIDTERGLLVRDHPRVYLKNYYHAEYAVARKLLAIQQTPTRFEPIHVPKALAWVEKEIGFNLATAQFTALGQAISAKVSIITGGPGVGKTTIIKALCMILERRKINFFLAAPTGRAAKRMSESTGRKATTLHRLLKFQPATNRFAHNLLNPLDGDCFIIDEASMFDIILMRQFVEALPDHAMLIVVGDTDQLPSVGAGHVLGDLIHAKIFPTARLNLIFRQDTTGYIVKNAHRINQGQSLILPPPNTKSDFYFVETADPDKILTRVIDLMTRRIPREFHLDPLREIQVLTPMRRALLGTDNLNARIQAAVNPHGRQVTHGVEIFRELDRVMQISNNYDKDVYNGDIGFVQRINPTDDSLVVMYDGRPVQYKRTELNQITLAYACSIHKSQGSEYPAIIIVLHTQHFKLLQRNLIYTALTRGKKLVCIVGSTKALRIALQNNPIIERHTTLAHRLTTGATGETVTPSQEPKLTQ